MRLPSLPGPRDVAALAEQALALLPRAGRLLSEAERLLDDVGGLLDRIEDTRRDADELLRRTEVTRSLADQALADIDAPFRRLIHLLDVLEPPLLQLQPTLDRLAETTDPHEVDALVRLVDQLPRLTDRLEGEVLPLLDGMRTVAPDIHELLELTRGVAVMLANLPGMGRVRRKIEEQDEEQAS